VFIKIDVRAIASQREKSELNGGFADPFLNANDANEALFCQFDHGLLYKQQQRQRQQQQSLASEYSRLGLALSIGTVVGNNN
jgi:DNA-binding NtrC family response regulator